MAKQGFIIDVPNVLIQTGNKAYISLTATEGQITAEPESITIEGGQGIYPLFEMNTKSNITISLTDAQFNSDQIEAFGATASSETRSRYEYETSYIVEENNTVTIEDRTIAVSDLILNGFTPVAQSGGEPAAATQGQVLVDTTTESGSTILTFAAEDEMAGKTITPVYTYTEQADSLKFLEGVFPKKAKVILQFPLYEDEDGNDTVPATVQITVYKASINASPTIGGSYKTASTFSIECTAMNPRRADKEIWAIDIFDNKE